MAKGKYKSKKVAAVPAVAAESDIEQSEPQAPVMHQSQKSTGKGPGRPRKEVDPDADDGKPLREWFDEEGNLIDRENDKKGLKAAVQRNFAKLSAERRERMARMDSTEKKNYWSGVAMKSKARKKALQGDLLWPVKRIRKELAKSTGVKVSMEAAVFAAAVYEYMAAELLELTGEAAKDFKRSRLVPRYIMLAIRNDDEIARVFEKTCTFREAGVTMKPVPKMLLKSHASKKNSEWDNMAWYRDIDADQYTKKSEKTGKSD